MGVASHRCRASNELQTAIQCNLESTGALGKLVAAELSEKLEDAVGLSWQELRATDLAGRARAFQSMVGGGMAVANAVAVSGLMVEE